MPSTRSKKAKARRSREADILSAIENMDGISGSVEYNQIKRGIDQITGFSNMLKRDDNEKGHSMRGMSSQDSEFRNMPGNRNNFNLSRDLLSGEINLRICQETNRLVNGMNSLVESAISSAFSERIIPQMQGVVETILNRQLESIQLLSGRPQTANDDERNVDHNNLQNRNSRFCQNLMEPEEESLYNNYFPAKLRKLGNSSFLALG